MNKQIIATAVISVVLAGGGAFFGGMKYAESTQPAFPDVSTLSPTANGQFGGGPNGASMRNTTSGAGFVAGEVLSVDETSMTVKLRDGGSKIVFFSESTKVNKSTEGALTDLKAGDQVTTNGTANDDGSVTASTVDLGGAQLFMTAPTDGSTASGQNAPIK